MAKAEYERALEEALQEDKEYLKRCLEHTRKNEDIYSLLWWKTDDTVLTVARILERWGQFKERTDVIDFFEKPYKFEDNMKFIVEEM